MANLFDVDNALTTEPVQFSVGDFVQWKREGLAADYPPATHSAEFVARLKSGGFEFKVSATETSAYYLFSISTATSAGYVAGDYAWQLEVTQTSSGNRIVVDAGELTILADLDVSGADNRSHAEVMLGKIESLLSGKADKDVSSYSIQGRSLAKLSIADLLQWRDYYRRELTKQRRDEAVKRGKPSNATVKVRFL